MATHTAAGRIQQQMVDSLRHVLDEVERGEATFVTMITSHTEPSHGTIEKVVKFEIRWPVQFAREVSHG